MLDTDFEAALEVPLRTLRMIVLALVMGVVTFAVMATVVIPAANPDPILPDAKVFTPLSIVFGGILIVARFIVVQAMALRTRQRLAQAPADAPWEPHVMHARELQPFGDRGQLAYAYMQRTLVAAALIESGAFLALVGYLLERTLLTLFVGALFTAGLALHFPSRGAVMRWIEGELAKVADVRRFAGTP